MRKSAWIYCRQCRRDAYAGADSDVCDRCLGDNFASIRPEPKPVATPAPSPFGAVSLGTPPRDPIQVRPDWREIATGRIRSRVEASRIEPVVPRGVNTWNLYPTYADDFWLEKVGLRRTRQATLSLRLVSPHDGREFLPRILCHKGFHFVVPCFFPQGAPILAEVENLGPETVEAQVVVAGYTVGRIVGVR